MQQNTETISDDNRLYEKIVTYDNFLLANMALGLLQENGIDCHLKDEYIVTVDPLLNPAVGGIKLMVNTEQKTDALLLIRNAESAYLAMIRCPKCGHKKIMAEERTFAPAGFWDKMKNMLLYGQESLHQKKYVCRQCGTTYSEPPPLADEDITE